MNKRFLTSVLILVMLYDRPLLDALTSGQLAEEAVRTLAASIALVLAVPVTTLLVVLVVKATAGSRGDHHTSSPREPHPPGIIVVPSEGSNDNAALGAV